MGCRTKYWHMGTERPPEFCWREQESFGIAWTNSERRPRIEIRAVCYLLWNAHEEACHGDFVGVLLALAVFGGRRAAE